MRRMYRKNGWKKFYSTIEPGYSRRRKYAYSRGDCRSSRRRINRGGQIHRYGDTIDMRGLEHIILVTIPVDRRLFERAIAPIYREKRQLKSHLRLQQG